MSIVSTWYNKLEYLPGVGSFFRFVKPFLRVVTLRHYWTAWRYWRPRIRDVLMCSDNKFIPRVPEAGVVAGDKQIMHNGISIISDCYYGLGMRWLIKKNRGVHEPQEERVFMQVLKYLPNTAVMIELGAYWGFYSMWFHKSVDNPTCYLIEPFETRLKIGQDNFKLNAMTGIFERAYVDSFSGRASDGTPIISVDDFVARHGIDHVNILHSDIQGAEYRMLLGSVRTVARNCIDYIFISTHENDTHEKCLSFLKKRRYRIIAQANLEETFSVDGVIVAARQGINGPGPISIDCKHKNLRD